MNGDRATPTTQLDEYYPYEAEIKLLHEKATEVAHHIQNRSILVELGCGSATKTGLLLNAVLDR
jgi:uncharacterized SAM-dependent methyltransferase